MINLFNKDSHIHFLNEHFVVVNNLGNGNQPVLVKRTLGNPLESDWVKIYSILKAIGMELKGNSFIRDDGFWAQELELSNEIRS